MANPQCENGHIRFASELWKAICSIRISGEARQVFDVIAQKTYGFNKKEDAISLSQFVFATKITKPNICQALTKLKEMNLITQKDNEIANVYSINKDYTAWKPLPKKITLTKNKAKSLLLKECYFCGEKTTIDRHHIIRKRFGGTDLDDNLITLCANHLRLVHLGEITKEQLITEKGNKENSLPKKIISITQKDNESLPKKLPTIDIIQKTVLKDIVLPPIISQEDWNKWIEHRKKQKKPMTEYAKELAIKKLTRLKTEGHDPKDVIMHSIENNYQGLFPSYDKKPIPKNEFGY